MARLPEETVSALARDLAAVLDAHVPGWTTSQPRDPGITILEVMAYVIDVLAYRQMSGPAKQRATEVVGRLHALIAGCDARATERVRYFEGRLLTASDLTDDQQYHRGKLKRALHALHGDGIVKGLEVDIDGDGSGIEIGVSIGAGAALTADGELLVIDDCRRCRLRADGEAGFVFLTYTERETGSTAASPGPDDSPLRHAARIEEGVGVSFGGAAPPDGVVIARLIRASTGWHVDRSFTPRHS